MNLDKMEGGGQFCSEVGIQASVGGRKLATISQSQLGARELTISQDSTVVR
jgi:hypothetical protein